MIFLVAKNPHPLPLPYFEAPSPSAGFPSPAADFVEGQLDLNLHLVRRPEATFFVRISGRSLERAGIHDGDLAVVDRSLTPRTGQIVVFVLYGELMVKRLRYSNDGVWFESDSEDPRYKPFKVPDDASMEIWGVVTSTIRDHTA
jgi:DNA polymerase V